MPRCPSQSAPAAMRAFVAAGAALAAMALMHAPVGAAGVPVVRTVITAAAPVPGVGSLPTPTPGGVLPVPPSLTPLPALPPGPALCAGCVSIGGAPSGGPGPGVAGTGAAGIGAANSHPGTAGTVHAAPPSRRGGERTPPAPGTSAAATAATTGLRIVPPPVQSLSLVPGISFGSAPYVWPLFLGLDILAAALAALVIRRTRSSPGH